MIHFLKVAIKRLIYFMYAIILNLTRFKKISYSAKVHPKSKLSNYTRINSNSYFKGELDSFSYIGSNCLINAKIGKFTSISDNVRIVQGTHPIDYVSTSPSFYSPLKQNGYSFYIDDSFVEILTSDDNGNFGCIIGNDVWIGEGVKIKGGVSIGDGAIIAMGSVVTKDVEPYSIVGGVPAKIIKYRFNEEEIKFLTNIEWWNFSKSKLKSKAKYFNNVERFIKEIKHK